MGKVFLILTARFPYFGKEYFTVSARLPQLGKVFGTATGEFLPIFDANVIIIIDYGWCRATRLEPDSMTAEAGASAEQSCLKRKQMTRII